MRLAFSNIAWPVAADPEAFDLLVANGYRGLEIAPTRVWSHPADVSQRDALGFRDDVSSHGLDVVAMQSLLFGQSHLRLFGDDQSRAGLLQHLLGMVELASWLGATRLVFGSPGNRRRDGMEAERAFDIAVGTFRVLGAAAADAGVCFCIEANPVEYGCDFLVDAGESTDFVRAVDSPGVRLHLDAACMSLAGDPITSRVRDGADILEHVHASAPELGPVHLGGEIDHVGLSTTLREIGYDGWVSVEMRATADPLDDLQQTSAFVWNVYA